MKKTALILLLCALNGPAGAAEINGYDLHGADLAPANYDILRGTFTNVGNFTITAGDTVLVASGERLAVYAATVTIAGHLNATGSGLPGGAAGGSDLPGGDGFSTVMNGAGKGGAATYGGGGGGHADLDADGASGARGWPDGAGGLGGIEYGLNTALGIPLSPSDAFIGSGGGGGGGGSGGQSGGGGSGGGAIYIEAGYAVVSGTISANGLSGGVGITTGAGTLAAGGGGGSGGSILIKSAGTLNVSGGRILSVGGDGGAVMHYLGNPASGNIQCAG